MMTQAVQQQSTDELPQNAAEFLRVITLNNFLSFGSRKTVLLLKQLNILIGSNGSGKSNFIEAINLLRASPRSLESVIRQGGGVQEWGWKGGTDAETFLTAGLSNKNSDLWLSHSLAFDAGATSFSLANESIFSFSSNLLMEPKEPRTVYFQNEKNKLTLRNKDGVLVPIRNDYDLGDSVLAQRKDPEQYPEITYLAEQYSRIRIYREWAFGRNTIFRQPQRADMRSDRLEEDFSNLGLFLNRLRRNPQAKKEILEHLRDIYEGVDDFDVSVEGGTVQVFLTEGSFTIPATRLSDGTLHYLCLLAILCDPKPPLLICIEEPELGLHPDILPKIADLLVAASQRTQLIVTTHSTLLVDAMTEQPESVIVCEKHQGQTEMTRLSSEDLKEWLEKYRLGELWARGDLGGTRW